MSTTEGSKRLGGISDAFSDRNFRIYSVGSIGSWISFFVQIVTVSWLTWELTGSTKWLAIMALLDIVPNVVLMPIAGAISDRFDRHKIMLVTSILLFLQAALLALVAWADMLTIWTLAVLVLMHGIFISLMVPAMYGIIPRFVGRAVMPSAIAVASAYSQLALFVGPALAGWIIAEHGTTVAFVVNALGYLLLICAFLRMRTPADYVPPERSTRSFVGDIWDGAIYIFERKTIWSLLLIMLVADAVALGFIHMLPAYADTVLGLGVVGMTTILAMRGLGAICAALRLAYLGAPAARVNSVLWAFLAALLALGVLVQTRNLYLAAGIAVVMGFAGETKNTGIMTIIQLAVDENQRGRVMGTAFMFSQLAAGIGAYLIGAFSVEAGVQLPTTVAVCVGLGFWGFIFLQRKKLFQDRF
ncbi:MFS transporter [Roseovarius sp. EL26]|uniref:MFS transporter n=1 Tax=Roseovarius sp. EL26 TaxID=2126672 RepID=UPI000EA3561A|nr:MFS transporter [Roseovarius sp. EL26]